MTGPAGIKGLLPHRYPMLLIDRIVEHVPGVRITALKAVSLNEPWYQAVCDTAADPEYRYPELLLVESWCQAAAVLCARHLTGGNSVMLFGSVMGIRFGRPVSPGDVLEHRARLTRALPDTMVFEGEAVVAGTPVLEVDQAVLALRPADALAADGGRRSAQHV